MNAVTDPFALRADDEQAEFLRIQARSVRPDVRNPLTMLPSARAIAALPPEAKAALRALLLEVRKDAQARAEKCWRKHKAPMAAYWKAVAVYAGHTSRICR